VFAALLVLAAHAQPDPPVASHPRHVEGELLVKFKGGPRGPEAEQARGRMRHEVRRHFDFIGWQQIRLPKGMTVEEGLARYRDQPGVEAVEPNGVLQRRGMAARSEASQFVAAGVGTGLPNDPIFPQQWSLAKIGATNAWAVTTGSSNLVVAVIDTGINYHHEDLRGNLWRNSGEIAGNGIDDDGNGYVDDVHGIDVADDEFGNDSDPLDLFFLHGSSCAGVIGAAGNNGEGIAGINWSVQLLSVRVFSTNGTTTFANLIEALNYATQLKRRGVNLRVISMSYGGGSFNQAMKDAHDLVASEGILQVAAAMNDGADLDLNPGYPACFNTTGLMAVAASDESDNLGNDAYWIGSNYGRTNVDLAAPGVAITAPIGPGTNDYSPIFDLSSAATPHVAGSAALLFAANPSLTMLEVKDILMETVDVLPAFTNRTVSNGRLNLGRAMQHPSVRTNSPPIIAAQPRDAVTTPAGNATLAARVIGTKPFRFQWRRDGIDVANATNAAVTVSASAGQAGDYTLVASNAFGVVTSDVARVVVTAAPVITTQPQSQTVIGGASATLSVRVVGQAPLRYLWSRNGTPVTGTTADLVLNTVQGTNSGGYSVVVTNTAGAVTSEVATLEVILKPVITNQPRSVSVSAGANVFLSVGAAGLPFLTHQWQRSGTNLPGAVSPLLVLANVQLEQAGDYRAVVSNGGGAVTSLVATVTVDPTFTKITSGPILAETGTNAAGAWGDYDGDGYPDLFVTKRNRAVNALFRNNQDGTFSRVTAAPLTSDRGDSYGAAWGDFDGDGDADLVVANAFGTSEFVYRNNGNGTFSRLTTNDVGAVAGAGGNSAQSAWADFDTDGHLDLFVANGGAADPLFVVNGGMTGAQNNFLFHNNGDGTFTPAQTDPVVTESGRSSGGAWGDYDSDGHLDLFVANGWGHEGFLYRNTGNGSFERMLNNAIATAPPAHQVSAAWGDYDNDGDLDLFVAAYPWNRLFRNDGGGAFTEVAAASGIVGKGNHDSGAWADYDNDGFLDLFVSNESERAGDLYHNNGNGTFARVTTGSPANDVTIGFSAAWADYDNNGFPDLFMAGALGTTNALYRNNGNSNHWLTLKLLGTRSNRDAIGAKVRVRATIGGAVRWQLRQVGGDAGMGQNDPRVAFGLGDATNADRVRIEWPSGEVQELTDVAPNQFLAVTEPGLVIAAHPRDLAVPQGLGATNTILAFSDRPLQYQWRLQGTNLPGQTNATLVVPNVQLASEGEYSAVVTDGLRSATSRVARLTTLIVPVITVAPISQSVVAGGSATFSVAFTGHPLPFGVEWRQGSILKASNTVSRFHEFFTLNNAHPTNTATWRVIVRNLARNTATGVNQPFTLTVMPDSDGDGLPDAWELAHGFPTNNAANAPLDADGDGLTNGQEYQAGTNPTNASSYLKVDSLSLANEGAAVRLTFFAASNHTYTVESRPAADTGAWTRLAEVVATSSNRVVEVLDTTSPAASSQRYYRLATPRSP
jgi:hypothetical protein